jgi:predicted nucleic acid-binding protein
LPGWFDNRLLHVDAAIVDRWGRLAASAGRTLPAIDSLLAATALQHDLRVVTRNASDFELPGLEVVDPWAK